MNNRTKRLLFLLEDGGRKTVSGVPPLIFKSDGSALKNYRFYGAAGGIGDLDSESGKYVVPVTIAGKNKFDGTLFNGYYTDSTMTSIGGVSGNYKSCKVYLSAGTYTFSCSVPVLVIRYITSDIYRSNPIGSKYTQDYTFTLANDSYVSLAFRNESNTAWDDSTTIQVELSQSATEYEPFHEPSTINIFLDEPVYEGESVSMEDTGVHIGEDTGVHIGTIDGTNILSVETTVQPSKVEVMGKIKAVSAQPVLLSRQISDSLLFGSENELDVPDSLLFGSENELDVPHQSAALTASPEEKLSFDVSEQLKGDDEYADDQGGYSSGEDDLRDNSENTDDFGSDSEVGRESAGSAGTGQ